MGAGGWNTVGATKARKRAEVSVVGWRLSTTQHEGGVCGVVEGHGWWWGVKKEEMKRKRKETGRIWEN